MIVQQGKAKGFTIIEVMVVMVVLSILAMSAMPLLELSAKRNRERELKQSLMDIRHALDIYKNYTDIGRIPKSGSNSGYPPTLSALMVGVPDQLNGGQILYIMRRIPKDPMAPDQVPAELSWGTRSYQSPPNKPQPGQDVFDVYSLSTDVGMNGIPYREW